MHLYGVAGEASHGVPRQLKLPGVAYDEIDFAEEKALGVASGTGTGAGYSRDRVGRQGDHKDEDEEAEVHCEEELGTREIA